jgi:hypothetical protein
MWQAFPNKSLMPGTKFSIIKTRKTLFKNDPENGRTSREIGFRFSK